MYATLAQGITGAALGTRPRSGSNRGQQRPQGAATNVGFGITSSSAFSLDKSAGKIGCDVVGVRRDCSDFGAGHQLMNRTPSTGHRSLRTPGASSSRRSRLHENSEYAAVAPDASLEVDRSDLQVKANSPHGMRVAHGPQTVQGADTPQVPSLFTSASENSRLRHG